MENLPTEIIKTIADHLEVEDVANLARTCKAYSNMFRDWLCHQKTIRPVIKFVVDRGQYMKIETFVSFDKIMNAVRICLPQIGIYDEDTFKNDEVLNGYFCSPHKTCSTLKNIRNFLRYFKALPGFGERYRYSIDLSKSRYTRFASISKEFPLVPFEPEEKKTYPFYFEETYCGKLFLYCSEPVPYLIVVKTVSRLSKLLRLLRHNIIIPLMYDISKHRSLDTFNNTHTIKLDGIASEIEIHHDTDGPLKFY